MNKERISKFLKVAEDCIKEAQLLYNLDFNTGTINRSYYAMFNSARATLQLVDIEVKSRHTVHNQFQQQFIKTHIFSETVKDSLLHVNSLCKKVDYKPKSSINKEDAATALLLAKKFNTDVKAYIDAKS